MHRCHQFLPCWGVSDTWTKSGIVLLLICPSSHSTLCRCIWWIDLACSWSVLMKHWPARCSGTMDWSMGLSATTSVSKSDSFLTASREPIDSSSPFDAVSPLWVAAALWIAWVSCSSPARLAPARYGSACELDHPRFHFLNLLPAPSTPSSDRSAKIAALTLLFHYDC